MSVIVTKPKPTKNVKTKTILWKRLSKTYRKYRYFILPYWYETIFTNIDILISYRYIYIILMYWHHYYLVSKKKEHETSFNFQVLECNPDILALLVAEIHTFEKNSICRPLANVKKWILEVKKSLFVIITIHNIFVKVTTSFAVHASILSFHFVVIVLWNSRGMSWKEWSMAVTNSTSDSKCLLCNSHFRAPKTQKSHGAWSGLYTVCERT